MGFASLPYNIISETSSVQSINIIYHDAILQSVQCGTIHIVHAFKYVCIHAELVDRLLALKVVIILVTCAHMLLFAFSQYPAFHRNRVSYNWQI